jgi:hypothetical protein
LRPGYLGPDRPHSVPSPEDPISISRRAGIHPCLAQQAALPDAVAEAPPSAVRPVAEQPSSAVAAAVLPSVVVAAGERPSEGVAVVAPPFGAAGRPSAAAEPLPAVQVAAARRGQPGAAAVPRPRQAAALAVFQAEAAVSGRWPRRVLTARRRWAAALRSPVFSHRPVRRPAQPAYPVQAE